MSDTEKAIAREFCRVLRAWLTEREMNLILERNAAELRPDICHSHDFCDANMAMLEAFTKVTKVECPTDEWVDVWNTAWTLAQRAHFVAEAV